MYLKNFHSLIPFRLDKALLETEKKFKIVRWKRSNPEYIHNKLLYYRKRLESLDNDLTSSGREYKILTEIKKKYASMYWVFLLYRYYMFCMKCETSRSMPCRKSWSFSGCFDFLTQGEVDRVGRTVRLYLW